MDSARTEPLLDDFRDEATLNIKDEEICAGLIEPVSMKNLKPRANSFQSTTSSTASNESTVSIRHGHVYNIKTKKEIPVQHKLYVFLFIASTVIATLFIYSTYLSGNQGFFLSRTRFRADDEKDDPVDWDQKDIVGFCLAAFFIMVAAGGGIGGGGVLVPTYILFLKFHPKYAIPLSNCTILGSSISNLALNAFKRHPQADRPLIDWDIMLMMEPLTIFGALIGTLINVVSPPWLITILLVIVLVLTAIKTLVKGFKSFAKESEKLAQKNAEQNGQPAGYKALTAGTKDKMGYQPPGAYGNHQGKRDPTLEAIPLDPTGGRETAATVLAWTPEEVKQWWRRSLPPGCQEYLSIVDECELDGADLLDLDMESLMQFDVKKMLIMKILRRIKMLKKSLGIPENYRASGPAEVKTLGPKDADPRMEKAVAEGNTALIDILEIERFHSTWKICLMFLLMGGCLAVTILKGGHHFNLLDVHCGQTLYWVLTFAICPWVLGISIIARNFLVDMYEQKEACGYEYLPHDVRWDARATIVYPLVCSTAGLCAGMFGIGGGIIKGPLMLQMNVLPAVTSGTSASMILFTSSMASVSYILFGQLNYHYAWILALEGLIFTFIGQVALNKIVAYYQRASLIILVIGLVVAMSAVMMGWESFHYISELMEGHAEGGKNVCAAKGEGRLL